MRVPFGRRGTRQFGRSTIEPGNPLTHPDIARVEAIEGHELNVLEGAATTIQAYQPNLLIECNDLHRTGGVARVASWLATHDDDAFFIDGGALVAMARFDVVAHWQERGIENFLGVHRSRPDVALALRRRIRALTR